MSFALLKFFKKRAPAIGRAASVALKALLESDLDNEKKANATEAALAVANAVENLTTAVKAGGQVLVTDDDKAEIAGELAALVIKYGLTYGLKKAF